MNLKGIFYYNFYYKYFNLFSSSLSQFGDKVNVNQQIDAFLVKLNYHILEKELDPKPLPDVDDEFKWVNF